MLKDITFGRYYPQTSLLHKLDSRTKMLFLVIYLVSVFFASSVVTCLYTALILAGLIAVSKIPLKYMFKGLKTVAVIIIVTDLITIFSNPQGLVKSLVVTLRMIEIVLASNLLTLTTKPKDLSDGLEKALGFLKAVKVPVHDISTMMAIAVRFIPILTSEADKIMEAQKARGADFESGNLVKRARALVPVLIPLFVSAFKKSDDLALAMDSRLYGADCPSRLHPLKFSSLDYCGFCLCFEYVAVFVLWRVLCL